MFDPFEDQLAQVPLREPPREWRAEILGAATRCERPPLPATQPAWWMQVWLRMPLPTLGFAMACGLTVLLSGLDQGGPATRPSTGPTISREQIAAARAERRELLQAFYLVDGAADLPAESKESSAPPPPATLPRPRSDRREDGEDRFGLRTADRFLPLV
jgi:hypothetical protein